MVDLSSSARKFLHAIQGGAGLEPADLLLVHRVVQADCVDLAVLVLDLCLHRLQGTEEEKKKKNDDQTELEISYLVFSQLNSRLNSRTLPGAKSFSPRRLTLSLGWILS